MPLNNNATDELERFKKENKKLTDENLELKKQIEEHKNEIKELKQKRKEEKIFLFDRNQELRARICHQDCVLCAMVWFCAEVLEKVHICGRQLEKIILVTVLTRKDIEIDKEDLLECKGLMNVLQKCEIVIPVSEYKYSESKEKAANKHIAESQKQAGDTQTESEEIVGNNQITESEDRVSNNQITESEERVSNNQITESEERVSNNQITESEEKVSNNQIAESEEKTRKIAEAWNGLMSIEGSERFVILGRISEKKVPGHVEICDLAERAGGRLTIHDPQGKKTGSNVDQELFQDHVQEDAGLLLYIVKWQELGSLIDCYADILHCAQQCASNEKCTACTQTK